MGGNIDVTGVTKSVSLGNPHGIVRLDVEGEEWTVEVGQPWPGLISSHARAMA